MREIPLTQGKVALVSDEDYELVSTYKWFAAWSPCPRTFYARTNAVSTGGRRITIGMHRLITGAQAGECVDHADHDGLNNQRANLRKCSRLQNNRNSLKRRDGKTSAYKGVNWNRRARRWQVQIASQRQWLGYHKTEESAALAYDRKARELFGEFAHCNFPEVTP